MKKKYASVLKEQDGMDLDVQLLQFVKMEEHGMFSNFYVNVLIIASGMEHSV